MLEQDPDWAAPVLWRSEFRNILAGYLRRGILTFQQADGLQCEAEDLLGGGEYEVDSLNVMELVRDSDSSAYDCEFVLPQAAPRQYGLVGSTWNPRRPERADRANTGPGAPCVLPYRTDPALG